MELDEVKKHYSENREEIEERLEEFRNLRDAPQERWFLELVFVILTSRSSAQESWRAAEKLDELGLLEGDRDEVAEVLARFDISYERDKAGYIVENREELSQPTLQDTSGGLKLKERVEPEDLDSSRKRLVDDLKGVGWKGASHFLRNVGRGNSFAIVSSRIVRKLRELGALDREDMPSGREEYLEVERSMNELAEDLGIEVKALDLVLWSMETGEVFK